MAPIPRLAYKPISILTGAILGAIGGPSTSSPPADGTNATVWGTEYRGTASLVDIPAIAGANATVKFNKNNTIVTSVKITTPIPSQFYYLPDRDSYLACDKLLFNATDNVVFMNPLQFGNLTDPAGNSTCGQWIDISSRANTAETIKAQIVGICDDCEYGTVSLPLHILDELAPELEVTTLTFDPESETNVANMTDASQPVSYKDILPIVWQLSDAPGVEDPNSPIITPAPKPTQTTTTTTTTTTKTKPTPTKEPEPEPEKPSGKSYTGRGTWFSDTSGQCEHSFSQSDMIVAVNEAQMGKGKSLCGKKLAVKRKGGSETVVVTVVDMCPSKYCDFGDLDISQGAFKKLAALSVGVLELEWSFL